jgi:hypothetical protein
VNKSIIFGVQNSSINVTGGYNSPNAARSWAYLTSITVQFFCCRSRRSSQDLADW